MMMGITVVITTIEIMTETEIMMTEEMVAVTEIMMVDIKVQAFKAIMPTTYTIS